MAHIKTPGWSIRLAHGSLSLGRTNTTPISPIARCFSSKPAFQEEAKLPARVRRALSGPDRPHPPLVRRKKISKRPGDRDSFSRDELIRRRNDGVLRISEEVEAAVRDNKPVVALESTIYTHGFPSPQNYSLALTLEDHVRRLGGVPATIAILNGKACIGLSRNEIMTICSAQSMGHNVMKVSRRDLPFILSKGLPGVSVPGQKQSGVYGGTTISGTMILAHRAGIKVFGSGGLGGVHRGGEDTMDISADLTELGRTPVAVFSSGCKSFLDIPRTLEYLETQGVTVCTIRGDRKGEIDFPAFYTQESGIKSPQVIMGHKDAARIIYAQECLELSPGQNSGFLFANPIPAQWSMSKEQIDAAINQAVKEAAEQGIHGHANTPFILDKIKTLTEGQSIPANRALIESNVVMATKAAIELCRLREEGIVMGKRSERLHLGHGPVGRHPSQMNEANDRDVLRAQLAQLEKEEQDPVGNPAATEEIEDTESQILGILGQVDSAAQPPPSPSLSNTPDIVVFGSLALDLSCDYVPENTKQTASTSMSASNIVPQMQTSNVAATNSSIGGVGHNVALAAHLVSGSLSVRLWSQVADDLPGATAISILKWEGLDTSSIVVLPPQQEIEGQIIQNRTAQYVAVNDSNKNLVVAMADMSLFTLPKLAQPVDSVITTSCKWAVIDANWHPAVIRRLALKLKTLNIKIAYEPVSVPKSGVIFQPLPEERSPTLSMFPKHKIDLATPNRYELAAMHASAKKHELFESDRWWKIIDALGIPSSGARDRFVAVTSAKMADEGIPLQTIQLLPLIPIILTKLGEDGVLLTELLLPIDPRLTDPQHAPYIISRCSNSSTEVGGVYMRLFRPTQIVTDIISVNGVGDTFLGIVVSGLARGCKIDSELINIAQRGAVMTLRSKAAVNPKLGVLSDELDDLATEVEAEGKKLTHRSMY